MPLLRPRFSMGSKIVSVECSGDNTAVIVERPIKHRRKPKKSTKVSEVIEEVQPSISQPPVELSTPPRTQTESEDADQVPQNPTEFPDLPTPPEIAQEPMETPGEEPKSPDGQHDQTI